ncbi:MAG: ParB/RepB/Spo0J family partition protein [Acidimicrobiales bacterium]
MNRRSGLGKGLGSLIPTDAAAAASSSGSTSGGARGSESELQDIAVSAIAANEYQPRTRFDEEALTSLTDSVRELGVLQPILVREAGPGRYELIAGERRWRAARRANLSTIPAVVRTVDNKSSLEQALVENLHREDLNALEEAAAYQQLIDEFDFSQEQVAKRVGKSRSAVTNTLRLFRLPGSVQRLVANGELGAGHARALLGSQDRSFQEALAARVIGEGLNVRQVEEIVREHLGGGAEEIDLTEEDDSASSSPSPKAPGEPRPAALIELEDRMGTRLDTRVHLSMGKAKGKMTVEFADLDDLERIFRIVMDGAALDADDD